MITAISAAKQGLSTEEIEGTEYDICSECWNPFAQRLRGKGRTKDRGTVFLPPPSASKNGRMKTPSRYRGNRRKSGVPWIGHIE